VAGHKTRTSVRPIRCFWVVARAVRFEMEKRLAPLLFKDESPLAPADPVSPAQRSPAARRKAATKRTEHAFPASSFRDLLDALGNLCRNRVRLRGAEASFHQLANANELQKHAFELLEINPGPRVDRTRRAWQRTSRSASGIARLRAKTSV